MSPYYFLFCIQSCRKLEIQNDSLKSPKSSEFGKIINYENFIILTSIQLNFKNREIKKIKCNASGRIRTRNPCV